MALGAAARAQDDNSGLPAIELLPCVGKCANSSDAEHIRAPTPPYPTIGNAAGYVEGFVSLRYNVGLDGKVSDIATDNVIGPDIFLRNAVDTLKTWTFKPATVNGSPVVQTRGLQVIFEMKGYLKPGGSQKFVADYKAAVELISSGNLDDALAQLTEMNSRAELNFYERGMLANLIAPLMLARKDYLAAREIVEVPSEYYYSELPPAVEFSLLKDRMQADLALGNIGDALQAANTLKKRVRAYDVNDPTLKLVDEARAQTATLPQIVTATRIPASGSGRGAFLLMSHRDFTFQNISGSLDKFQIQCRQATIASKISEAAEWHVPKDWNQCRLFVQGAPGTTFNVVQFASTNPAASK